MAIISYCRPFGPNEKTKKGAVPAIAAASLDFMSLGVQDAGLVAAHELLMALRNTALAHSSHERYPTSFNRRL
jgi:hypothetical protein